MFMSMFLQCWLGRPEARAAMNVLFGISRRRRCIISTTVAIMNLSLGCSRQYEIIFSVLQTQSAVSRTALGHSGVADERCVRERAFERKKFVRLVLRVRPAVAVPQNEVAAGLFDNPRAEVLVGAENYLPIFGNLFYDVEGVAACADYVAQLLYARAGN